MGLAEAISAEHCVDPRRLDQFWLYSCNVKASRLHGFKIPPNASSDQLCMAMSCITGCLRLFERFFSFLALDRFDEWKYSWIFFYLWSSWVWRMVQAGMLCMVWWTVVHLRAFGSVPPSDFCRGSCKKHQVYGGYIATSLKCWVLWESVWPRSDPSTDCELSWPFTTNLPSAQCRCTWWMLCMMENVLGVKVACLWLCLCCVSCRQDFEIAFVPYFWGKLALMCSEFHFKSFDCCLQSYWPYWTYETTTQLLLRNQVAAAVGSEGVASCGPKGDWATWTRTEADGDISALNWAEYIDSYKLKPKSSLDVWIEFGKLSEMN